MIEIMLYVARALLGGQRGRVGDAATFRRKWTSFRREGTLTQRKDLPPIQTVRTVRTTGLGTTKAQKPKGFKGMGRGGDRY